jgi:hypothetical protein
MKKLLAVCLITALFFTYTPMVQAGQKGASDRGLEKASDMSVFNRSEEWFATVGKSDEEKAKIKAELKTKWAKKRAEKEAKIAQKEADKKAEKAKKEAGKTQKDMGKKLKGWQK